jgi:hypothetical protein
MVDLIKRALTRTRVQRGKIIREEPDMKLVYVVKFGIGMTACLTAIEIAHLALLRTWNSEIFAAITGLSGTVMGIFWGRNHEGV